MAQQFRLREPHSHVFPGSVTIMLVSTMVLMVAAAVSAVTAMGGMHGFAALQSTPGFGAAFMHRGTRLLQVCASVAILLADEQTVLCRLTPTAPRSIARACSNGQMVLALLDDGSLSGVRRRAEAHTSLPWSIIHPAGHAATLA